MFEFSICLSTGNIESANKLYADIKESASVFGAIVTSYNQDNFAIIVVGCEDVEKPRISFFICDAIADIITTKFKLNFIEKNLKLPLQNKTNLNALKKALVAFDRETDKYIVTHNLKLTKNFYIESFYEFKLQKLRTKWLELIKLANENAGYLLCNDTFIDLLKFLIDNIEISNELINVVKVDNTYKICDANFKEIDTGESGQENDAFLITSLISLSPKRINVYCSADENSSVLSLVSQVFENRVFILPSM